MAMQIASLFVHQNWANIEIGPYHETIQYDWLRYSLIWTATKKYIVHAHL
jgi:hypothetical protein